MATQYIGRFAPSPSGPLHLGSLFTAVTSFLHATAANGRWLVRIEDLDTPRCVVGATDDILGCLEAHELWWDGTPLYQSQRVNLYNELIDALMAQHRAYGCSCTRKMIQASGGVYLGTCRDKDIDAVSNAIRLRVERSHSGFDDLFSGFIAVLDGHAREDCVIRRRDEIIAYNFAVVIDDTLQSVSHVVRGADLVDATVTQLNVFDAVKHHLGAVNAPLYGHTPLLSLTPGNKLSKQNKAPAVDIRRCKENLVLVFTYLGLNPPSDLYDLSCNQMLVWASECWQPENTSCHREIVVSPVDSPYHIDCLPLRS